jgi:DNA (cytosine-5)-methyltransferase 1
VRPRLLDLFCGAGGAAIGYERAGFQVVGVDIRPQPNYPFAFQQRDAVEILRIMAGFGQRPVLFDAIHASPPCQSYSPHVSSASSKYAGTAGKDEPALIPVVRELLQAIGLPYVIENVVGVRREMRGATLLCGTMFGLPIPRHRRFETSFPIGAFDTPRHPKCSGVAKRYAEERGWNPRDMTVTGKGRNAGTTERWKEVMGWPDTPVTQHGLREAIPPAYTEWLGQRLIAAIKPNQQESIVRDDAPPKSANKDKSANYEEAA